jgi:hypothetical protein
LGIEELYIEDRGDSLGEERPANQRPAYCLDTVTIEASRERLNKGLDTCGLDEERVEVKP